MFENQTYHSSTFSKDVNTLLSHPIINKALSSGGFIAGGFGRTILNNTAALHEYLTRDRPSPGDIDIFFPSVDKYRLACEFASEYCKTRHREFDIAFSAAPSLTNFCTNVFLPESELFPQSTPDNRQFARSLSNIKIQLVNVFHGDPETVLNTFDIENCKVAITANKIIYSSEIEALENGKTLKVSQNTSPLLPARIQKYIYARGLRNIHWKSGEKMRDWILDWRFNNLSSHPMSGSFVFHKRSLTRLLQYEDLIKTDQLSLLFGHLNYDVELGSSYNRYWKTIDPVKDELKRRQL